MFNIRKCWRKSAGHGVLKRVLTCVPAYLDAGWRWKDFRFHRSYGGLPRKYLKVDGHSPLAFLLPAAVTIFLIYGPTLGWRGPAPLLLSVLALGTLYLGARLLDARYLFHVQMVYFAGLCLLLWSWTVPESLESGTRMYRHWLIALFPLLILPPLVVARLLGRGLFEKLRRSSVLRRLLSQVELLSEPPAIPRISSGMIWRSFVNAPLRYPLHLVFLPALLVLFLPYYLNGVFWAGVFFSATWILLWFASIHDRFNAVLPLLSRAFFIGGQLMVSLAVIGLAAGRLAGVSYIRTVVESSPWGTLLGYVTCAYVVFWFFEYWLNRMLCEKLVGLLQGEDDPVGWASYDLDPRRGVRESAGAEPRGRVIQVHGGGRLIVIGRRSSGGGDVFETFERKALFRKLVDRAGWSETLRTVARSNEVRGLPAQLSRYTRYYFSFVNLIVIAAFLTTAVVLNRLPQAPLAAVSTAGSPAGIDLAALIRESPAGRRLILLSASGGGSRAALYTQSVLRGLNAVGVLDDLVLVSGVSGGGVALAYYAAHRNALKGVGTERLWNRFSCDMSHAFIQDVLEGAAEWRIATGTRSGQLLAESFQRVFYHSAAEGDGPETASERPLERADRTLATVDDLGLIFNTAIAGHLYCPACRQQSDFPRAARNQRNATRGTMAGGRLVITNLESGNGFPQDRTTLNLPYVVIRAPDMQLTTAAALSANFPPVFSNAALDVDRRDRYWITDGGAVENRGLISLLLALRGALEKPIHAAGTLPDIHIVMVEASSGSNRYVQDRGIGSKFGAPTKIANQLIRELLDQAARLYRGRLYYHELPMPEFLRIDGGLGTHWMLPRNVEMRIPDGRAGDSEEKTRILDAMAVRHIIDGLHHSNHSAGINLCPGENPYPFWETLFVKSNRDKHLEEVREWLADAPHRRSWQCLRTALTGGDCPAAQIGN